MARLADRIFFIRELSFRFWPHERLSYATDAFLDFRAAQMYCAGQHFLGKMLAADRM